MFIKLECVSEGAMNCQGLSLAKSLILGLMILAVLKGTVNVISQHVTKAFKECNDAMRNVMQRNATYKTSTFTVARVPGV